MSYQVSEIIDSFIAVVPNLTDLGGQWGKMKGSSESTEEKKIWGELPMVMALEAKEPPL